MLNHERLIAEGASTAALSAVREMEIADSTVVIPVSWRNLSTAKLRQAVGSR
jgi:threonine dehydratase